MDESQPAMVGNLPRRVTVGPPTTQAIDDITLELRGASFKSCSPPLYWRKDKSLFFFVRSWYFTTHMNLPHWVEQEFSMLPDGFTGRIIMEFHRGGVSRIETNTSRQAPAPVETVRHALSA